MNKARGFTLLELIVVIVLAVLFMAVALEKLLPLRAHAERAACLQVLGGLRSAIGLHATRAVMADGMDGLRAMHAANPMAWLQVAPANYVGVTTTAGEIPPGHWAYLATDGLLVYRVRFDEYVEGASMLRFRTEVEMDERGVSAVRLIALDDAGWNFDGLDLARWLQARSGPEELSQSATKGMPASGQQ